MTVQVGSTNPRGPVRRGIRVLGLVTPPVLLAGIVAVGILGPRPEEVPDPAGPTPSVAPVRPEPSAPLEAPPAVSGPGPGFPAVVAGLGVRSILDAETVLLNGSGKPIAVAGLLATVQPSGACPSAAGDTRGPMSPLCERRARLVLEADGAAGGVHLHVRFPPGVRLPAMFEDGIPDTPAPVVIVGRGPVDACVPDARGCGGQISADLLAWVDGAPFQPGPVFDAGLQVPPSSIAYRHRAAAELMAVGSSGTVLLAAVIRPSTVPAIDPDAATALAAMDEQPEGLVWYVRAITRRKDPIRFPPDDNQPRMDWAVLDETTGKALAVGVAFGPDAPRGTGGTVGAGAPFPAMAAGLPVLDVAASLGRGGVVAVAGWFRAWADPAACTDPVSGLPGGGCPRTGLLIGAPWSDAPGATAGASGPVVHVEVPPGVAIPDTAVGIAVEDRGPPPPVVALGRYDEAGSLHLESVAWVSGQTVFTGRQVAAGLAVPPGDPLAADAAAARDGLGGADTILRMVLVPGSALAVVDPAAASRLAATGVAAEAPLWYLRGFTAAGTIRWAVAEPGNGRVLASADAAPLR